MIHVPDLQADAEYRYTLRDVDPIRTELGVPMFRGDDIVGIIILYKFEIEPFTEKQIELVQNFANQAVHRHRECAASGRAAPVARAADRDCRSFWREYFKLEVRTAAHTANRREYCRKIVPRGIGGHFSAGQWGLSFRSRL